jgi:hypothetical protein
MTVTIFMTDSWFVVQAARLRMVRSAGGSPAQVSQIECAGEPPALRNRIRKRLANQRQRERTITRLARLAYLQLFRKRGLRYDPDAGQIARSKANAALKMWDRIPILSCSDRIGILSHIFKISGVPR